MIRTLLIEESYSLCTCVFNQEILQYHIWSIACLSLPASLFLTQHLQLTEQFNITRRWTEEWIRKVFSFLNVALDADFPEIIPATVDFLVSKNLEPNYVVYFLYELGYDLNDWSLILSRNKEVSFCHCLQTITGVNCIPWVSGMFPWRHSGQSMGNFTWIFFPNV
jgi:hypothetical protein